MKANQKLPSPNSPFGTQPGTPRPPCTKCGETVDHWSAANGEWYKLCSACHALQLERWRAQKERNKSRYGPHPGSPTSHPPFTEYQPPTPEQKAKHADGFKRLRAVLEECRLG